MIRSILPLVAVAAEAEGDVPEASLLPEEVEALGSVCDGRRRQFTIARHCARQALKDLGVCAAPILRGADREPLWPTGVVGSITHCRNYCAAAVAYRAELAAIGIDAEVHRALPKGVMEMVALDEERRWIEGMHSTGICWDTLLFSAKESVFKAWFPLASRWLGFQDVLISFKPQSGTFAATILIAGPIIDGRVLTRFEGRCAVEGRLVLSAACSTLT
jgi:4'-phosphopantetheinyl transferase EntD